MKSVKTLVLAGGSCCVIALASFAGCSSSSSAAPGDDGGTTDGNVTDTHVTPDNNVPDNKVPETGGGDTATDDSSMDTGTDTGGMCAAIGGDGGGFTTGNMTCDDCLAANCCSQVTNCVTPYADGGTNDCANILFCVVACVNDGGTTSSCATPCVTMYPNGANDAIMLQTCQGNSCATECGGGGDGGGD
jgi:hypothetical protein